MEALNTSTGLMPSLLGVVDMTQWMLWIGIVLTAGVGYTTYRIWTSSRRQFKRLESFEKHISEILTRVRNGDTTELRRKTQILEQGLEDTMKIVRDVASAMDVQIESLRTDIKSSLSKIDRGDSQSTSQTKMIIYQLERIRHQLRKMEHDTPNENTPPTSHNRSSNKQWLSPYDVNPLIDVHPDDLNPSETSDTIPEEVS